MVDYIIGLLFVIGSGFFAYMAFHINEERKQGKTICLIWEKKDKVKLDHELMVKRYMDKLPEKREEGFPFNKPPLTGKGQFDKQRTTYTEGDNT